MTRKKISIIKAIPIGIKSLITKGPIDTYRRVKRYRRKSSMPLPTFVQIEVTTLCNFKCVTCSRESLPLTRLNKSVNPIVIDRLLEQLPDLQEIKLQGLGEPLMTPGIDDIIKTIRTRNPHVRILTVTNGSLLTLKKYREIALSVDDLRISFDSSNAENFEKIRVNSRYSRIMEGVKLLSKERTATNSNTHIAIDFVATHLNYNEILDLEKIAVSLQIDEVGVNEVQNWYIHSQKEYLSESKFIDEARKHSADIKKNVSVLKNKLKPYGIKVVSLDSSPMKYDCTWPFSGTFITSDGFVTSCCIRMDPEANNFGNIFEEDFRNIWNNEKYREFRTALILGKNNGVCDNCPN